MATTKIWKVENRLDHVIKYTTNDEKTKNNYLENGIDEYDGIRQVMMYAIKHAYTTKEFHKILESMGYNYYYRAAKLTVRREPYKRKIRVERAFGEDYTVDNIKKRILENDYVWRGKIVPYRVTKVKYFSAKSSVKKKHKPKGIIALYYYYKFLLGFYKKNNIEYKLTSEMQKAVEKMEFYSEQIRFMCKYKLETTAAVDDLKNKKLREKQIILNKRNKLYYDRKKCSNEEDKDSITKDIILVTDMLKKVKKEIKLCDVIYNNVPDMKQQIKEIENKELTKEQKKNKERINR